MNQTSASVEKLIEMINPPTPLTWELKDIESFTGGVTQLFRLHIRLNLKTND